MHGGQAGLKRASYPLELELDGCELPCRCWEVNPNPGYLEEQPARLTVETALLPHEAGTLIDLGALCLAIQGGQ